MPGAAARSGARLAEQRSHVADFAVKSPIDGHSRAPSGGRARGGGRALFTVVLDQLYVKMYVPEPASAGRPGTEARVCVDAYPGQAFPRASAASAGGRVHPEECETREERVKLVFAVEVALAENPGGILKPGMPVDAAIRWQPDAPWK
jgi:HlyD family secretion protein